MTNSNATPGWFGPCDDNFKNQTPPTYPWCKGTHCTASPEFKKYTESFCTCTGVHKNMRRPNGSCPNGIGSLVPIINAVTGYMCFCCCNCLAFDTPVAVTESTTKVVQDFKINDMVFVAANADLSKWHQMPVEFSSGTGPNGQNKLLKIKFGDTGNQDDYLLVTADQPFYLANKTLKLAGKLVPGSDELSQQNGTGVAITSIEVGYFNKGVHHISTSTGPSTSVDNHLLLINGIVAGDLSLQLGMNSDQSESLPDIGSREYNKINTHLTTNSASAYTYGTTPHVVDAFESFSSSLSGINLDQTVSFFTQNQAEDLEYTAPSWPIASAVGLTNWDYLTKMLHGFYPEITFYLDDTNQTPNAYSFKGYGVKIVVVNGGLIRLKGLDYDGLVMVVSHQLARFMDLEPSEGGYSCQGKADLLIGQSILPYVYINYAYRDIFNNGLASLEKVFNYLNPLNKAGHGSKCNDLSINCRIAAIKAGLGSLESLPECAGGPKVPTLEVDKAVGTFIDGVASVLVTFNEAIDPQSATLISNYSFLPKTPTKSVALVSNNSKQVQIILSDLKKGIEYNVDVTGVTSSTGSNLVDGKNTATFTL